MTLSPGSRLGPYEIQDQLGAGGMGEVYRARDTRLDRTVAIKVLPAHLAANAEFRQRFEREARIISNLNHPHICTLHDIGSQDGVDFLVMEYLEGQTLAARLAGGPLALDEALHHAIQIADALAEAHRFGVSHRDLKPGNVMLTRSGAKLLDFGLAKLAPATPTGSTLDARGAEGLTVAGAVLGTFQYMAPEQLEGKEADPRSDLFAFGLILYEMLTGRKVSRGEPPAPTAHPHFDRIIVKCLARDPDDRWQSAADLRTQLQWIGETPAAPAAAAPRRATLPWAVAALLLLVAAGVSLLHFREAPPPKRLLKLSLLPPEKSSIGGPIALSPDGSRLAFPGTGPDGRSVLWVRPLDSLTARPLPGTEGAIFPFWSPDGRSLGFFTYGKLKRIDIAGGPPLTLCDVGGVGRGGAWNRHGVIIYAGSVATGIHRVADTGGAAEPVTTLDSARQEVFHRAPHFLPDGRQFLYLNIGAQGPAIYAASLDSKSTKRILGVLSSAVYAPGESAGQGHLLFAREGALMAQPFDVDRLELAGQPFPLAEGVSYILTTGGNFAVSHNAVLAYGGSGSFNTQLTWFDRSGKPLGRAGPPGPYLDFDLSPDEKRVVVSEARGLLDLWLLDLARGSSTRFTFDPGADQFPIWSPDGSRIVFSSIREGSNNLFWKVSSGAGRDELLLKTPQAKFTTDWSADGHYILYYAIDPKTKADLWVLPLTGDRKPLPFLQTEFNERQGRLSPDGRFMAYVSDESGRWEVYMQPFPATGAKWTISTGGGADPRWRRDGKELYYLTEDRKLMAVEVKTAAGFDHGIPKALFDTRFPGAIEIGHHHAASADGRRFLVQSASEDTGGSAITVEVNWNQKD